MMVIGMSVEEFVLLEISFGSFLARDQSFQSIQTRDLGTISLKRIGVKLLQSITLVEEFISFVIKFGSFYQRRMTLLRLLVKVNGILQCAVLSSMARS